MTCSTYLRRLAVEAILFFALASVVFFFATGRESLAGAMTLGAIASGCYGGVVFVLRHRATHPNQRQ